MRKLSILTLIMGSTLVFISQIAFSGPLVINAEENTCIFLDTDGITSVTVSPPDKIKLVQRGKKPPLGTCKDASITTGGDRPVFFDGTAFTVNSCTIYDGSGFTSADYTQKIDKKGTTLTCHGVEPPGPQ